LDYPKISITVSVALVQSFDRIAYQIRESSHMNKKNLGKFLDNAVHSLKIDGKSPKNYFEASNIFLLLQALKE